MLDRVCFGFARLPRTMRATFLVVASATLLLGCWTVDHGRMSEKAVVPSLARLWSICFGLDCYPLRSIRQFCWRRSTSSVAGCLLEPHSDPDLVLSPVLVRRFGAIGVLSATIISYLLCVILPQTWDVRRVLRGRYLKRKTEEEGSIEEVLSGACLITQHSDFRK